MTKPVGNYHDLVRVDILDRLPSRVGRVLDFGGGVGATGAALKKASRASCVVVADMVSGQHTDVDHVYHGDLEDEAFVRAMLAEAGPFDTILALDVLEHLRDPWRTVHLLRDGLAPGGLLVISIPNVNYHRLVMPLLLRGQFTLTDSGILDRTHIRWFVKKSVIELVNVPGLATEDISTNIFGRRELLFSKLTFGLFDRFVALQYVVLARKVD